MIEQQWCEDLERIRLVTRFGEFEADPRHLVTFPLGLPGFEGCRRFALLSSPDSAPLQCLHAVGGPAASFVAIDPRRVIKGYRCVLSPADRERLRVSASDNLLWLALIAIDANGATFANLRAPIVINPATMMGFQVMPHDGLYPLRHPVVIG